ncbi:acyltransferase family protein [Chitinibacter tainanensis]|uniref:acyltransferase family protein n=1 Tax=Chitinibacter tainanensis TaxID=230667 RepID=UPI0004299C39|nr:acyltransferase [Chitinibacter tainanensis]
MSTAQLKAGPAPATQHVAIVDGLRGLAIALVILFHYWQITWWVIPLPLTGGQHNLEALQVAGALGVELFFFLSAFCLTYPQAKTMLEGAPLASLAHYTYRRAIKILPSYWLAMLILLVCFPTLYPTSAERGYWVDVLMHLTFIHNLFADTHYSINGVFWSLGVEVQFYLLFPLLAWGFRRQPWLVCAGMVLLALAYRAWTHTQPLGEFSHRNNQLPGFLDLFAAGMLSAYLLVWLRQGPAVLWAQLRPWCAGLVLLALLVLALLFADLNQARGAAEGYALWQSAHRLALAGLFVVLVVAGSYAPALVRSLIANRVTVWLSLLSYNLYLWHQVVARVIKEYGWWPAATPVPMDDPSWRWSMFVVAWLAALAWAALLTYGFERPLLQHGVRGVLARLRTRWQQFQQANLAEA